MSIYGENVARVSEILSAWNADGDGLVNWAARIGPQWEQVRQHAADVGTHTHEVAEAALRRWDNDADADAQVGAALLTYMQAGTVADNELEEVRIACSAFASWAAEHTIRVEHLEHRLIDHDYGYGGTADFKGIINGRRCLIDFKTSGRAYKRHKVQLAAYALLHELHLPDEPIDVYAVLRLDKKTGRPDFICWENLDIEKELFSLLLDTYGLTSHIKMRRSAIDWGVNE